MSAIIRCGTQGPITKVMGIDGIVSRFPGPSPPAGQRDESKVNLQITFWWPHWLGVAIADKLIREGSLPVSPPRGAKKNNERRIDDAVGFFQEMDQLSTKRKFPSLSPYHSLHGFWWHYVATKRPGLEEYPADLFRSFCAPWQGEPDFNDYVQNSMYRECRHGVGHAVWYTLATREAGGEYDVRKQRLEGTLALSDEAFCEAKRICDSAPEDDAKSKCRGGLHHSVKIFSPAGIIPSCGRRGVTRG